MKKQTVEVLFIGNKTSNNCKSIGGANTYTEALYEQLIKDEELSIKFLQIRKVWAKGGQIFDYLIFPFRFLKAFYKADIISIHATWDFHLSLGPFVSLVSKIFKKRVIYHFFGGHFHNLYESYPFVIRLWLDKTILSSNYKLMETKRMIKFFERKNLKNFVWFPNSRKAQKMNKERITYSKNLVFVSRVSLSKGIDQIIKVSKTLPDDYTIDIYGPLDSCYINQSFGKARYKGVLMPDQVIEILKQNDILLLPTFHDGEGYPGIFVEAMSVGMPIICSRWNALDELVEDGYNGKLIQPKSISQLQEAILFFNQSNYREFSKNALKNFENFNIETVSNKLVKLYKV